MSTYLADTSTRQFDLADGYRLNLAAAVRANRFAARALMDRRSSESVRRMMVRTVILLARPVDG